MRDKYTSLKRLGHSAIASIFMVMFSVEYLGGLRLSVANNPDLEPWEFSLAILSIGCGCVLGVIVWGLLFQLCKAWYEWVWTDI